MVFSSSIFLILFLPIVLLLYYNPLTERICEKKPWVRNSILILSSLIFYAWGEPIYVFLMILSVFVTYIIGFGVSSDDKKISKSFLIIGIAYHVIVLFVFKYSSFVLSQAYHLVREDFTPAWSIALPIGISFYTFQLMSYLFDIYYGHTSGSSGLSSLLLYATMFPQLIAGPIVRYSEISKEISGRVYNRIDVYEGTERFIYGLGKKVILADQLAYVVDKVWALDERTVSVAWLGAICYTMQIYFDFSGYSDMAIGLGRIFGFHFPENFNYPYISKSVTEFWRRWHISLSSWFRDYVYIPLGGNRVSKAKWIRNIFIVWLLTGVWHGANWTFLCWGLIYFSILLLEKYTDFPRKLKRLSHVYTMMIVMLAWVIFRSDSLYMGIEYIAEMFGYGNREAVLLPAMEPIIRGTVFTLFISSVLCCPLFPFISGKLAGRYPLFYGIVRPVVALAIFIISIAMVVGRSYTAFIYFNF